MDTTPLTHDFDTLTRDEALAELARRGLKGTDVYLLDVLPLVEMAWSDGTVQDAERQVIYAFLEDHLDTLNREAGVQLVTRPQALRLVQRFLGARRKNFASCEACCGCCA
jgi:hypothetical protein